MYKSKSAANMQRIFRYSFFAFQAAFLICRRFMAMGN